MENQYRIHSTSHVPSLHTILSGIFFLTQLFYPTQHSSSFCIFFWLSIPYTPPPQVLSCPLLFRMPPVPTPFNIPSHTLPPSLKRFSFIFGMLGIRDEVWAGLAMDDRRLYSPPPSSVNGFIKERRGGGQSGNRRTPAIGRSQTGPALRVDLSLDSLGA